LAQWLGRDELVINTWPREPAMRHRSMRLAAQVYQLQAALRRSSGLRSLGA
jgi:hypothetical protein